jgi:hypothetical protein
VGGVFLYVFDDTGEKLTQIPLTDWQAESGGKHPPMISFRARRPPLKSGELYRMAWADSPLDGCGGVSVLLLTGRVHRGEWRRARGAMRRTAERWRVTCLQNMRCVKTMAAGEHAAAERPLDDLTGETFTEDGERIVR